MQISGTGITPFEAKIKPDFKVDTRLAIEWVQGADGNYNAIDRGSSSDEYFTTITIYNRESTVNNFITEIEANRSAGSNELTLSGFNDVDDRIFGADVDHSGSITAVVVDYGERTQRSLKGFGVNLVLKAVTPTFLSPALSLPDLCVQVGYTGTNEYTIKKYDTYTGTFTQIEHGSDTGIFRCTLQLPLADMAQMRHYLTDATVGRGNTIAVSNFLGVTYPFGPNRGTTPWNTKVISWEDLGHVSIEFLRLRLTFVEVV